MRRHLAFIAAAAVLLFLVRLAERNRPDRVKGTVASVDSGRARAEVAPRAAAAPPSSSGEPVHEPPDAGPPAEIERLIASVDWAAYAEAALAWFQADEEARRTGKQAVQALDTIETLSRCNQTMARLAEALGVEDVREVRYHERVAASFVRGWLQAAGVTLSPDQEARLGDLARSFSRSRAAELEGMRDANRLERLAWEADREVRWEGELSGLLTPDQLAPYREAIA